MLDESKSLPEPCYGWWLVAGLLLWRCGFYSRPVHMRFVVNKVALGQVFLSVIKFSPVSIILPMLLVFEGQVGKAWEP
jgi:hypothetical protein